MEGLKIALQVLFMPADGFRRIKRDRARFTYTTPIVILFLMLISRIAVVFLTHYPLSTVQPEDTNLFQEIIGTIVPVLTWVASCYLITAISDGECLLREVFAASAYSMLPYVLFSVPISLLSNIMSTSEAGIYSNIQNLIYIWVALLILTSLCTMNSYSLFKTLGVALIIIFACLFLWVVAGLLYVLGYKLFDFIVEVITEYRLLLLG